jgi:iron complex outermembrane recepter protein
MLLLFAIAFLLLPRPVAAQQAHEPTQAQPAQQPPRFDEKVDVVAITPLHGLGLARTRVPANVQVFTADRIGSSTAADVATVLSERASSVQVSDAQGGTFQPDLLFRGFVGSPLLGASEGLAVYQDGVRVNEAFGDTVNWDALPTAAIASINLTPGSNPLFGLNALGGALSIRTKDGFAFPGRRASVTTGSFGRHRIEVEAGGHGGSLGYFVAGALVDEGGWRAYSPSTVRRLFGDVAWRGTASSVNVNVTAASNDMTGNGAAPVRLLENDRAAVFTHPDRTDNDLAMVTVNGQRQTSETTVMNAVAYYRDSRMSTFNGDAADDDRDGGAADDAFDGVNNLSTTRGHAAGVTGQLTSTASWRGKENHFILGAGLDASSTRFDFAAEWAHLTPERGTIGAGIFDDDALVDLHSRTTTAGAFVTNTWSITSAVSITGSARFNWTGVSLRDQIGTALNGDHSFARLNPAAGVTYQARKDLNLYGGYAQSSRVPTAVELTCADPEDPCRLPNAFVSDPPLDQIVARTWEIGARGVAGRANWNLSAFTTASTDDVIFVSSGTLRGEGHFENVERTRRRGVEASVGYDLPNRISAFGTYTIQQATFGSDLRIASRFHPMAEESEIAVTSGSRLPGVPTHSVKFGIAGFVGGGLNLGVAVRAQSGQYLRGDEANLLTQLPGFAVAGAHARQRITNRLTAVAQIQNIFDVDYYTFGMLGDAGLLGEEFGDDPRFYSPGSPRAAWIGLEVRF